MSNKNILVLTHGEDVDGIISAVLLILLHKEAEIICVQHKNQYAIFRDLAINYQDLHGVDIYVADLALKNNLFEIDGSGFSLMEIIAAKCRSITWIDHHSSVNSEYFEALGGRFIFSGAEKCCTAGLISRSYDVYFENDQLKLHYVNFLTSIAQSDDYPDLSTTEIKVELSDKLQRVITCVNLSGNADTLKFLINQLVADDWGCLNDILGLYEDQLEKAEKNLEQAQEKLTVCGYEFIVAYVDAILPQKETNRRLRLKYDGEIDGCALFYGAPVNNVLIFRDQTRNNFNAQDFCISMGGGGRDGDGGYSLTFDLTPESFERAIFEFSENIKSFKVANRI